MIINIHNYHIFAREERSRSLPIINKSRKRINVSSDKFSTSGMPSPVSHFDQSGGVSHSRNTVTPIRVPICPLAPSSFPSSSSSYRYNRDNCYRHGYSRERGMDLSVGGAVLSGSSGKQRRLVFTDSWRGVLVSR